MTGNTTTPSKYNPTLIGDAILMEILEQRPTRLTVDELLLRIVGDPDDNMEADAAAEALRDLRRACLVRYRNDDRLVEPTQAAVRAYELRIAM